MQGYSGRQVHIGVAGGSQCRGSVTSSVMIGAERKSSAFRRAHDVRWTSVMRQPKRQRRRPRQSATHHRHVVYSCALFQRGMIHSVSSFSFSAKIFAMNCLISFLWKSVFKVTSICSSVTFSG